jgi:sucrose phosphorylase
MSEPEAAARAVPGDGRSKLRAHLAGLYGEPRAGEALPRLEALLARRRDAPPAGARPAFMENDAILITYPDQVWQAGLRPLAVLGEFCRTYAAGLATILHVLPFYPSSSDDGFAVRDHRAVESSLGTWDDVRGLGRDFRLMFDAVVNHASAQGEWFQSFLRREARSSDHFIAVEGSPDLSAVVRPRTSPLLTTFETESGPRKVWTTFSADQPDLNYASPDVLLEVLDILLGYVDRGAGLLRLDAVGYLWKEIGTSCIHLPQTHRIVQFLRAALDHVAPQVLLVTETNVPHAENVSYFGDGRNEAQLVYNFALPPLVLHALLRGDARWLREWARGLSTPGPRTAFLNFLASHDGIGLNPARALLPEDEFEFLLETAKERGGLVSLKSGPGGEPAPYELNINYLDALASPGRAEAEAIARFVAAHAILLALCGVPAVYFHSLFGSRGWPEGVAVTGRSRTINREKLAREQIEADLRDPRSRRFMIHRGISRLLRARASSSAFAPAGAQEILNCGDGIFGLMRRSEDEQTLALCLHNLTGLPQRTELDVDLRGPLTDLLTGNAIEGREWSRAALGPYEVRWIGSTSSLEREHGAGSG